MIAFGFVLGYTRGTSQMQNKNIDIIFLKKKHCCDNTRAQASGVLLFHNCDCATVMNHNINMF